MLGRRVQDSGLLRFRKARHQYDPAACGVGGRRGGAGIAAAPARGNDDPPAGVARAARARARARAETGAGAGAGGRRAPLLPAPRTSRGAPGGQAVVQGLAPMCAGAARIGALRREHNGSAPRGPGFSRRGVVPGGARGGHQGAACAATDS